MFLGAWACHEFGTHRWTDRYGKEAECRWMCETAAGCFIAGFW